MKDRRLRQTRAVLLGAAARSGETDACAYATAPPISVIGVIFSLATSTR